MVCLMLLGREVINIATIKLYLNDWLNNVGVLGVYRILSSSEDIGCITREKNYIEFDSELLNNFGEKYFDYFIKTYEKFTSWYRITSFESYIDNFNMSELDEDKLKYINTQIEYTKLRVKSASYKSAYVAIDDSELDLLKEEKKLKKISKNKKQGFEDIIPTVEEQFNVLKRVIEYLSKDNVKKIIAAKNVIYDVIALFLKDVSFLNKNASKNSMYQEYNKYFLNNLKEYIEEDKEKHKYVCFTCSNEISKLSKPYSYDLTWINRIGVDMNRKTSHFWNFNADAFVCPICNLVYSCIPAGFNVLKGKGLFINDNSSIDKLIKVNNLSIQDKDNMEDLENASYYNILDCMSQDSVEQSKREIENIQVIKVDSDNASRPFTFNILSKEMLKIFSKHNKNLKKLVNVNAKVSQKEYINLHREVLRRLYSNINQFDLIHKLLVLKLNGNFNKLYAIKLILNINNDFIGISELNEEVSSMSVKGVIHTQDLGYKLKLIYEKRSATKKIDGITYRLLNALKTKNIDRFIENIIKSYMYVGQPIPTIFIDALKNEEKFSTIGYAFILGLQGESSRLDYIKREDKKDAK